MIVSPREKKIAIVATVCVVLMIAWYAIISPYMDNLALIDSNTTLALKTKSDGEDSLHKQAVLNKVWLAMQSHGLKTSESQADSQLQHAVLDWEQESGVNQQTLKQDQPRKEGDFQVIGYRVTATGNMVSINRFIWALETAPIPVRVTDVRITPEKEGTDNLSVQLGVSTLSAPGGPAPVTAPSSTPASKPATLPSNRTASIGGFGS